MNRHPASSLSIATLALVGLAAWSAPQPPPLLAGGVAIGSLPFPITQPGTYYLTGNLTAGPGEGGIEVQAEGVVIDLCGYTLRAGAGAADSNGVGGIGTRVEVRNGTIEDWSYSGVSLGEGAVMRNLRVRDCGGYGVNLSHHATVEDCWVEGNALGGIRTLRYGNVTDCTVEGVPETNGVLTTGYAVVERVVSIGSGTGFRLGEGTKASDCTAKDFEETGFRSAADVFLQRCTADVVSVGDGVGFSVGSYSCLDRCVAVEGLHTGIEAGDFCSLTHCKVKESQGPGMIVGEGTTVSACTVTHANQAGHPDGGGFLVGPQVQLRDSIAAYAGGPGFHFTGNGGRVAGSLAYQNTGHGFGLLSNTAVEGNLAGENAGAGFRVDGDRLVLRGNLADANGAGIVVRGRRSLVVDNRAVGNAGADFDVMWGNPVGTVNSVSNQIPHGQPEANYQTPLF